MTAKEKVETSIHAAIRNVAKLPEETPKSRVAQMGQRLVLGLAVGWLGVIGVRAEWNEWLVVPIFFVSGNLISNQLLGGFVKKSIAPLLELRKVVKGGD